MFNRKNVKKTARFIVGFGTGVIVSSIVQNNVGPQHIAIKCAVYAARFVLASAAANVAAKESDSIIDTIYEELAKAKTS